MNEGHRAIEGLTGPMAACRLAPGPSPRSGRRRRNSPGGGNRVRTGRVDLRVLPSGVAGDGEETGEPPPPIEDGRDDLQLVDDLDRDRRRRWRPPSVYRGGIVHPGGGQMRRGPGTRTRPRCKNVAIYVQAGHPPFVSVATAVAVLADGRTCVPAASVVRCGLGPRARPLPALPVRYSTIQEDGAGMGEVTGVASTANPASPDHRPASRPRMACICPMIAWTSASSAPQLPDRICGPFWRTLPLAADPGLALGRLRPGRVLPGLAGQGRLPQPLTPGVA